MGIGSIVQVGAIEYRGGMVCPGGLPVQRLL